MAAENARLRRENERLRMEREILNPLHYLALLEHKSKALGQAAPLDNWQLSGHGQNAGPGASNEAKPITEI